MIRVFPAIGAVLLAACTFPNPVAVVTPESDSSAPGSTASSGHYLLVHDEGGARLSRTVRASGLSCAWDTYPVSIHSAAPESARAALRQVFQRIEFADTVPLTEVMRHGSLDGAITFRVETFGTRLEFGGPKSSGVATTEFGLSAKLNTRDGRGFVTSASAIKSSGAGTAQTCGEAQAAVGRSIELAMHAAFEQVGASLFRFEEAALAAAQARRAVRAAHAAAPAVPSAVSIARKKPNPRDPDAERIARDRLFAMKRRVNVEALALPSRNSPPRPLTPAQIEAVRLQIRGCLTGTGFQEAQSQSLTIRLLLNPDGSLAGPPEIGDAGRLRIDDKFRSVANGTRQALIDCTPFKGLPRESYAHWRDMTLAFDGQSLQAN